MMPVSSLIVRHRSGSAGQQSSDEGKGHRRPEQTAQPQKQTRTEEIVDPSSRRTAKAFAVNGFVKDVLEGLTSEFFMSEQNVDLDDERSFDPEVAAFLKKTMRDSGCSFDQARLDLIRMRMRQNNIDPDTGLPLDEKTIKPSDAIRRGTKSVVIDIANLPPRRGTMEVVPSKWDTGLIDDAFVDKINAFFGSKS